MKIYDVIILGGGFVGPIISNKLIKKSNIIIEKSSNLGGNCRSKQLDNIIYDTGGPHIIFSKSDGILMDFKKALGQNFHELYRDAYIDLYGGIKFPYENGIAEADIEIRKKFIKSLINSRLNESISKKDFQNLGDFFEFNFGEMACKDYFFPYNEKIWNMSIKDLDYSWTKGRVQTLPIDKLVDNAFGDYSDGNKHQANFLYPKEGGIQALANSFKPSGEIVFNETCKTIKKNKDSNLWELQLESGEFISGKHLISTIPFIDVLNALSPVREDLVQMVREIKYNSLLTFMFAWEKTGSSVKIPLAIYNPDLSDDYHRLTSINYLSETMVPDNYEAVIIEKTIPMGFENSLDIEVEKDNAWNVVQKLIKQKLGEPKLYDSHFSEMAYVVNTSENTKIKELILGEIEKEGILCCGRLGRFEYINMDQAYDQASKLADQINEIIG